MYVELSQEDVMTQRRSLKLGFKMKDPKHSFGSSSLKLIKRKGLFYSP